MSAAGPGSRWCAWLTPVVVLAAAVALLSGITAQGPRGPWLLVAVLSVVVGHLSWPARTRGGALAWPALIAVSAVTVMLLAVGASRADAVVVAALALGVALVSAALEAVAALLCTLGAAPAAASGVALLLLGIFAASPVWLGPWAEVTGHVQAANVVVAVSPLSYLAALAQYDYLRGQWFYAHSPLGSLRFDYPGVLAASMAWAALAALCRGLARFAARRGTRESAAC